MKKKELLTASLLCQQTIVKKSGPECLHPDIKTQPNFFM
jgi:hypothetical protein